MNTSNVNMEMYGALRREHSRTLELTDAQDKHCELLFIQLLSQPQLKMSYLEATDYVYESLNIDEDNWTIIARELFGRKIVKMTSSNPDIKHDDMLELNVPGLLEMMYSEDKPSYLTPGINAAVYELRDRQKLERSRPVLNIGFIMMNDAKIPQ